MMVFSQAVNVSDEWLRGRRVVVMGLGRFGGGVAVARFLAKKGANVLVTDRAEEATLSDSLASLAGLDIRYRLGGHSVADLDGTELLIISPAVDRLSSEFYHAAMSKGIPWTTEVNLFLSRFAGRVVGVTGSIGKSTTCAMTHAILASDGAGDSGGFRTAYLGGNIGSSLLDKIGMLTADDVVVMELSSFQLDMVPGVAFRPAVAGITNVRPHHLDRHGDLDSYVAAKLNLIRQQAAGDVVVLGSDDPSLVGNVERIARETGAEVVSAVWRSEKYELSVPGKHNQANAHMAVALACAVGVEREFAVRAVSGFSGLAHRLELVADVSGVSYYNDSKSTSAEAVVTALEALERPTILLCGGKDIGEELNRITEAPWDNVKVVICFGEAGDRLCRLIESATGGTCRVMAMPCVKGAAVAAREHAERGDVVVLSPGCPSYDAFMNYEKRGEEFVSTVRSFC